MDYKDIFAVFDSILEDRKALVALAIKNKSVLKDLVHMLTNDFVTTLGNNYSVVVLRDVEAETGETSHYFYVFDTRIVKTKMDNGKVGSVLHLATNILGGVRKNREKKESDLERLLTFEKRGIVTLSFDEKGNLSDVKLRGCVLLIRVSGHNPPEAYGKLKDLFNARRNIVEQIHYYNIEEIEGNFPITVNKVEYARFKAGKKRIMYEFREKLVSAGIETSIVEMFLSKVNHIFTKHNM